MKKNEKIFLILTDVFIFILVIYPLFLGGVVGGYDPGFHMGRIQSLATNLGSGHFPNPIGFEYLHHFGYGIGFFYGNFLLYPFAIIHLLGLGLYQTYLFMIGCFIFLNILTINYVTHKLFHNTWATILSAPIYLSATYFITVIYVRAAIGELMAFAIIPWIFLSLFKIIQGEPKYWVMFGISFSLLLVTHILSFLIVTATALLYAVMNIIPIWKNKPILFSFLKGTALFLGLSCVFLLPFIQQYMTQSYVSTAVASNGQYSIIADSAWVKKVIFQPTKYITINGIRLAILIAISVVYYLYQGFRYHFKNKLSLQSLIVIVLYSALIFSNSLLNYAVSIFKPMVLLQAISRVCVVLIPLLTLLVANALGEIIGHFKYLKFASITVLFALIAVVTIMLPIKSNLDFVANRKGPIPHFSISMGEYEPSAFMNYQRKQGNFQINSDTLGNSEDIDIVKNNHYEVVAKIHDNQGSRTIMLPRLNYLGYQITTKYNGKTVTKPATTKNGLVATKLPSSLKSGTVTVKYRLTTLSKLGWAITIVTLLFLLGYGFQRVRPLRRENSTNKVIHSK